MLKIIVFWVFQLINAPTALGMFLTPGRFHETMIKNPEEAYRVLGFSPTAVEMLHNVIRGQGAALLAISIYLFFQGAAEVGSPLLIALTCGLSLVAHLGTMIHHLRSPVVMSALGTIRSMYGTLAINAVVGILALIAYLA